ncbi:hypothetical protein SeLEV6574_g08455 [Synchytrium endobioticum]|uniref:Uncharacterized protein n=1 Tax=Synchytrium endobioticum TaxID=286115 RepID=A0A507BSI0_9FUNG|nr:hypothetical protein SeLEV6574_g08455 [Synchytrium endobioticum]
MLHLLVSILGFSKVISAVPAPQNTGGAGGAITRSTTGRGGDVSTNARRRPSNLLILPDEDFILSSITDPSYPAGAPLPPKNWYPPYWPAGYTPPEDVTAAQVVGPPGVIVGVPPGTAVTVPGAGPGGVVGSAGGAGGSIVAPGASVIGSAPGPGGVIVT